MTGGNLRSLHPYIMVYIITDYIMVYILHYGIYIVVCIQYIVPPDFNVVYVNYTHVAHLLIESQNSVTGQGVKGVLIS